MIMVEEVTGYDWREDASCWEIDPTPFFKEGRGATYPVAREFCAGCPVVIDCLIEGLSMDNFVGFWGAMSPNERSEIRMALGKHTPFKRAVEKVWGYHRRRGNPVPDPKVWKEWS